VHGFSSSARRRVVLAMDAGERTRGALMIPGWASGGLTRRAQRNALVNMEGGGRGSAW
jgi:hypothetical protein